MPWPLAGIVFRIEGEPAPFERAHRGKRARGPALAHLLEPQNGFFRVTRCARAHGGGKRICGAGLGCGGRLDHRGDGLLHRDGRRCDGLRFPEKLANHPALGGWGGSRLLHLFFHLDQLFALAQHPTAFRLLERARPAFTLHQPLHHVTFTHLDDAALDLHLDRAALTAHRELRAHHVHFDGVGLHHEPPRGPLRHVERGASSARAC